MDSNEAGLVAGGMELFAFSLGSVDLNDVGSTARIGIEAPSYWDEDTVPEYLEVEEITDRWWGLNVSNDEVRCPCHNRLAAGPRGGHLGLSHLPRGCLTADCFTQVTLIWGHLPCASMVPTAAPTDENDSSVNNPLQQCTDWGDQLDMQTDYANLVGFERLTEDSKPHASGLCSKDVTVGYRAGRPMEVNIHFLGHRIQCFLIQCIGHEWLVDE